MSLLNSKNVDKNRALITACQSKRTSTLLLVIRLSTRQSVAEMDLNQPRFVPSVQRSGKPVLQYDSRRWPGSVLEFSYKSSNPRDPTVQYYRCTFCFELSTKLRKEGERSPVAHLTLRNGILATDPDNPSTAHSCDPTSTQQSAAEVLSRRYMCEVRTEIRRTNKRPRDAYNTALSAVDNHFDGRDEDVRSDIKSKLVSGYGYASKRRALSYNRNIHTTRNVAIGGIPTELQKSFSDQDFLRHEDLTPGREMLIFFTDDDLRVMLAADCILGDGNFAYSPPEFSNPGQLYTLHVIINGESHPVVYCLMKRRDQEAYKVLFQTIKDAATALCGHLGTLQHAATWLFDFELAAIQAAIAVFSVDPVLQPITVHGCAFHFAKALNEKRDSLGLRQLSRTNLDVQLWFSRVRHLLFVPDEYRLQYARDLIGAPPRTGRPLADAQLQCFAAYFENF